MTLELTEKEKKAAYAKAYYQRNKEKLVAYTRQWRLDNPEKQKAMKKAWGENNPEQLAAERRRYREKHREAFNAATKASRDRKPEQYKAKKQEWKKANPEKLRANSNKRRVTMLASAVNYTAEEWLEIKAMYGYTCLCCGEKEPYIKLALDHILPIAKGGDNGPDNIQPLCTTCNLKKYTKYIDYRVPESLLWMFA